MSILEKDVILNGYSQVQEIIILNKVILKQSSARNSSDQALYERVPGQKFQR